MHNTAPDISSRNGSRQSASTKKQHPCDPLAARPPPSLQPSSAAGPAHSTTPASALAIASSAAASSANSLAKLPRGLKKIVMNAASAAPSNGPTHMTHKSRKPPLVALLQPRKCATIAGPKDRVGLMEQPSMGNKKMCAMKTAKPMAMAVFGPARDKGDTATSQTTMQSKKVPTASARSARPTPKSSFTTFAPRFPVKSASHGTMAARMPAPNKLPASCMTKFAKPWYHGKPPPKTKEKVTAPLICPPDKWLTMYASTRIDMPNAKATTRRVGASLAPNPQAAPQPMMTKRVIASISATAAFASMTKGFFPSPAHSTVCHWIKPILSCSGGVGDGRWTSLHRRGARRKG
mmetsp:Transcript_73527/g.212968  ORF Transcript_73527/g.212968 Transcript_73527/m.212968 type:complete len:349 (+) Transcript_73527:265-1311(+)